MTCSCLGLCCPAAHMCMLQGLQPVDNQPSTNTTTQALPRILTWAGVDVEHHQRLIGCACSAEFAYKVQGVGWVCSMSPATQSHPRQALPNCKLATRQVAPTSLLQRCRHLHGLGVLVQEMDLAQHSSTAAITCRGAGRRMLLLTRPGPGSECGHASQPTCTHRHA
jgi:hypothetical protein